MSVGQVILGRYVFGFTGSNWLLGSRKEIQSAGREPEALCVRLSNISDNSVSLREIHSLGFFFLFVLGFLFV